MSKYNTVLLNVIFVLVLLNLGLTWLVLERQVAYPAALTNERIAGLDPLIAKTWGEKVATMYNQQDHRGLYRLFNEQAKLKISHQQLQNQLKNLFKLFGQIENTSFVSAHKIGEKGDELYYSLLFNISVSEVSKQAPKLTIVVVKKDAQVSMYGVRINASYDLE